MVRYRGSGGIEEWLVSYLTESGQRSPKEVASMRDKFNTIFDYVYIAEAITIFATLLISLATYPLR